MNLHIDAETERVLKDIVELLKHELDDKIYTFIPLTVSYISGKLEYTIDLNEHQQMLKTLDDLKGRYESTNKD